MKNKISTCITLDPEVMDYVQDLAIARDRSLSYIINRIVKDRLEIETRVASQEA